MGCFIKVKQPKLTTRHHLLGIRHYSDLIGPNGYPNCPNKHRYSDLNYHFYHHY